MLRWGDADDAGHPAGAARTERLPLGTRLTVLVNLITLVIFAGLALGRPFATSVRLLGGVTVAMLLVGIVYGLLLNGLLELSGGAAPADTPVHKVTTVMVPLYWLAFVPKGGLDRRDAALWLLLPALSFTYAPARGAIEGIYAYPFMNVTRLGWSRTALIAIAMGAGFVLASLLMVEIDRRMGRAGIQPLSA